MKKIVVGIGGGIAILGVIVMMICALRFPYRVSATVVPVASDTVSSALAHNIVYFFDLYAHDLAATDASADVTARVVGASDVVRVTAYGATPQSAVQALRDAHTAVQRDVQAVYGTTVTMATLRTDHTVTRRAIVALAPYGIMIAVAVMAVVAVMWFFEMRENARMASSVVPSWEARRVFASVHPPTQKHTSVPTVAQLTDKKNSATAHIDADASVTPPASQTHGVAQEQKDDTIAMATPAVAQSQTEQSSVTPSPAPVSLPSGLQTTPGNLPVVDVTALGIVPTDPVAPHTENAPEPTEAELKARLNALLGGTLS